MSASIPPNVSRTRANSTRSRPTLVGVGEVFQVEFGRAQPTLRSRLRSRRFRPTSKGSGSRQPRVKLPEESRHRATNWPMCFKLGRADLSFHRPCFELPSNCHEWATGQAFGSRAPACFCLIAEHISPRRPTRNVSGAFRQHRPSFGQLWPAVWPADAWQRPNACTPGRRWSTCEAMLELLPSACPGAGL